MEQTCPHCGQKCADETAAACPSCGGKPARRAREYDSYAVGRRLLRLAPAWLLLIVVAFGLALVFLRWVTPRGGASGEEDFRNEATNQPAAAPGATRTAAGPSKREPAAEATPAATAEAADGVPDEAGSYSVQVGAYAELSQANEQVSRLRASGFEARVVEPGGATRFRFQVRSGRYTTREEAAHLAADLRARGVAGETVIVDPQAK